MPTSKRPCRICHRWFEPDLRAGRRQRTCTSVDCQRERHRRSCVEGRVAAKKRARKKLLKQSVVVVNGPSPPAEGGRVLEGTVRDSVPARETVPMMKFVKVLGERLRDSVTARLGRERHVSPKVLPHRLRDATDGGGPSP